MSEQQKAKGRRARIFEGSLPVLRRRVAGIDLGSRTMQVAGPPAADGTPDLVELGTTTGEILRLVEWLRERQVESVAMESTGVYWIPVLEMLENAGIEALLVDSGPLARVPGRKTDMLDCQWIQRLHSCGLLRGCYRPQPEITEMRTIARNKAVLISEQADWLRRIQKLLDEMNVRVHHAVSDISGTTGMAIIRAIVDGERDPKELAAMRDPRCHKSEQQITEFLTGNLRSDHLFNLKEALGMYDFIQNRIEAFDAEIARRLKQLSPPERDGEQAPPLENKARMKAFRRRGEIERRDQLYRMLGVDLTTINGVGVETAETIISEYGMDLSKFPTEKEFIKHVRLAPRQNITGGKPNRKQKGRTGTTRTAQVLRNAAAAVARTSTSIGAYYRRQAGKSGPAVAVFATARKIATHVFRVLRFGQPYFDEGQKAYEERYAALQLRRIKSSAAQLGYDVVERQAVSA